MFVFDQYRRSIKSEASIELIADYVRRLLVIGDLVEAEAQIDTLKSCFGETDAYREFQVSLLLKKGNYDEAVEKTAVYSDQLRHRPDLRMESLLALGQFQEAEKCGRDLVSLDARNQFFWGLYATALRANDNPFYRQLVNYDQFIKINYSDSNFKLVHNAVGFNLWKYNSS